MDGWIYVHKKFLSWEWFCKSDMVQMFIYLLLNANYKDSRYQGYEIKRGDCVTGRFKISENTKLSEQVVRTCLSRLKSTNEITIKSTSKFSIITICNYEYYQNPKLFKQPTKQPKDQQSLNQHLTSNQPHLNNINNINNEKEDSIGEKTKRFSPPTLEELLSYSKEIEFKDLDCERFIDYYQSKGWMIGKNKMKDWKAAVRTWRKNENKDKIDMEKIDDALERITNPKIGHTLDYVIKTMSLNKDEIIEVQARLKNER